MTAVGRAGSVWDDVRRALGRVVGRVVTHSVSADRPEAAVREARCLNPHDARPVAPTAWQPEVSVTARGSFEVEAGAGGVDLAAVATVISADQGLQTAGAVVRSAGCRTMGATVHCAAGLGSSQAGPDIQGGLVRVPSPGGQAPAVRFAPPGTTALPIVRFLLPSPRKSPNTGAAWKLQRGPVRGRLDDIVRVPLRRERLIFPGDEAPPLLREALRALSAGAGLPEADVVIIGVYPRVPLSAVRKLALADGATLQVWLKTEALGPGRTEKTAWATVVLGRQRSTGKSLQAVLRG